MSGDSDGGQYFLPTGLADELSSTSAGPSSTAGGFSSTLLRMHPPGVGAVGHMGYAPFEHGPHAAPDVGWGHLAHQPPPPPPPHDMGSGARPFLDFDSMLHGSLSALASATPASMGATSSHMVQPMSQPQPGLAFAGGAPPGMGPVTSAMGMVPGTGLLLSATAPEFDPRSHRPTPPSYHGGPAEPRAPTGYPIPQTESPLMAPSSPGWTGADVAFAAALGVLDGDAPSPLLGSRAPPHAQSEGGSLFAGHAPASLPLPPASSAALGPGGVGVGAMTSAMGPPPSVGGSMFADSRPLAFGAAAGPSLASALRTTPSPHSHSPGRSLFPPSAISAPVTAEVVGVGAGAGASAGSLLGQLGKIEEPPSVTRSPQARGAAVPAVPAAAAAAAAVEEVDGVTLRAPPSARAAPSRSGAERGGRRLRALDGIASAPAVESAAPAPAASAPSRGAGEGVKRSKPSPAATGAGGGGATARGKAAAAPGAPVPAGSRPSAVGAEAADAAAVGAGLAVDFASAASPPLSAAPPPASAPASFPSLDGARLPDSSPVELARARAMVHAQAHARAKAAARARAQAQLEAQRRAAREGRAAREDPDAPVSAPATSVPAPSPAPAPAPAPAPGPAPGRGPSSEDARRHGAAQDRAAQPTGAQMARRRRDAPFHAPAPAPTPAPTPAPPQGRAKRQGERSAPHPRTPSSAQAQTMGATARSAGPAPPDSGARRGAGVDRTPTEPQPSPARESRQRGPGGSNPAAAAAAAGRVAVVAAAATSRAGADAASRSASPVKSAAARAPVAAPAPAPAPAPVQAPAPAAAAAVPAPSPTVAHAAHAAAGAVVALDPTARSRSRSRSARARQAEAGASGSAGPVAAGAGSRGRARSSLASTSPAPKSGAASSDASATSSTTAASAATGSGRDPSARALLGHGAHGGAKERAAAPFAASAPLGRRLRAALAAVTSVLATVVAAVARSPAAESAAHVLLSSVGLGVHAALSVAALALAGLVGAAVTFLLALWRVHWDAVGSLLDDHHVAFCFSFLIAFPHLVAYVSPWAPPWAPVCLWYAFLVQLLCTSGPRPVVVASRLVLPVLFMLEGISHHSFLLDLNGGELLVIAFALAGVKSNRWCNPLFMMSLSMQSMLAVFVGESLELQWMLTVWGLWTLAYVARASKPLLPATTKAPASRVDSVLLPTCEQEVAAWEQLLDRFSGLRPLGEDDERLVEGDAESEA